MERLEVLEPCSERQTQTEHTEKTQALQAEREGQRDTHIFPCGSSRQRHRSFALLLELRKNEEKQRRSGNVYVLRSSPFGKRFAFCSFFFAVLGRLAVSLLF